uniref:Uncharacterized protein n=1 Tax=Eutreptiella gymnastica TaxID=73025 RepID=A0A7S1J4K0_9EUGL
MGMLGKILLHMFGCGCGYGAGMVVCVLPGLFFVNSQLLPNLAVCQLEPRSPPQNQVDIGVPGEVPRNYVWHRSGFDVHVSARVGVSMGVFCGRGLWGVVGNFLGGQGALPVTCVWPVLNNFDCRVGRRMGVAMCPCIVVG